MNDAAVMRGGEGVGELHADVQQLPQGQRVGFFIAHGVVGSFRGIDGLLLNRGDLGLAQVIPDVQQGLACPL